MLEFHLAKELRRRKLSFSFTGDIEPQEIILDELAQQKELVLGISEKRFEIPLSKFILQAFLGIIFATILVLFAKTFQMQILDGQKFSALAQENRFVVKSLHAIRGVVYDAKGQQIVFNKPSFDLILDKRKWPLSEQERQNAMNDISLVLGQDAKELENKISQEKNPVVSVFQNLDQEKLIALSAKIDQFPGFEIAQNAVRDYIDPEIFSPIIGYTGQINSQELKQNPNNYSNSDYIGKDGLEKTYEDFLRKNSGKLRIERDAKGNIKSKEIIALPESGDNLVLWLDAELQKKLYSEIQKSLEQVGAKKGIGVAMDPKTGGILALVSIPSYDNNLFSKGSDSEALKAVLGDPQKPLFNRAIAANYPSGSIIKPLLASGVLEEKIISPDKKIYDPGYIEIKHKYNPEIVYRFGGVEPHGWVDMRQALAVSSNIYFYTVGGGFDGQEGLGPTKIKKYLELFGWGSKTNIDLPGEGAGLIPSPQWKKQKTGESWWDGDTYNMSIGQGNLLVTPIQVASAFSAIANNGVLLQPQLVKKIENKDKNTVQEFEPKEVRRDFISKENLQIVREGMRNAVSGQNAAQASATILNSLPLEVAAKTGTAQTSKKDYFDKWVSAFAPYENPEIVLTVMIEDVYGMQQSALPVAKEVLQWYFGEYLPSIKK